MPENDTLGKIIGTAVQQEVLWAFPRFSRRDGRDSDRRFAAITGEKEVPVPASVRLLPEQTVFLQAGDGTGAYPGITGPSRLPAATGP
ncbi:MAG: hypothetical protein LBD31_06230 [Treponema sp.]|jgi:hypothetical protein|nr:hypothetical protein [Treponema sp.]